MDSPYAALGAYDNARTELDIAVRLGEPDARLCSLIAKVDTTRRRLSSLCHLFDDHLRMHERKIFAARPAEVQARKHLAYSAPAQEAYQELERVRAALDDAVDMGASDDYVRALLAEVDVQRARVQAVEHLFDTSGLLYDHFIASVYKGNGYEYKARSRLGIPSLWLGTVEDITETSDSV